jgi:hypothetical protein
MIFTLPWWKLKSYKVRILRYSKHDSHIGTHSIHSNPVAFHSEGVWENWTRVSKILTELESPKKRFQSFVPQKQSSIFNLCLLLDKFGWCVTNDSLLHQGLGLIQKCFHQHKIFHSPLNILVYFIIAKLHSPTPPKQTHTHNTFMSLQKQKKTLWVVNLDQLL